MNTVVEKLTKFFSENDTVIIVNTTTNIALLCLNPVIEENKNGMVFVKFDSLNDHDGNSVMLKSVLDTPGGGSILYVEFEDGNVLMLQALSLENYRHYIQPQYVGARDFNSLDALKQSIKKQI